MPRANGETSANRRQVSLHTGASFAAAWENVLLPWFQSVGSTAIASREPVAVVTPLFSSAAFLRAKLLDQGISLLGVRFITPVQLRELLLADKAPSLPLREHLRLLLSI